MGKNFYSNAHPGALKEVARLLDETIEGRPVSKELLMERLGTTDGIFAFANLANQYVQENYANTKTAIVQDIAAETTVSDFRTIQGIDFFEDFSTLKAADKGVARPAGALPEVAEGEKYQAINLTQTTTAGFSIKKYGAQIGYTWEAFVNDPYNTISKLPQIFAQAAVTTIDTNATRALYTAANAATHLAAAPAGFGLPAVTADSGLSMAALIAAQTQLALRTDSHGNYIDVGPLTLTVSPAMEATARWVLSQTNLTQRVSTGSGSNNYSESTSNISFGNITLSVNPYLATYAGNTTTWILSPRGGTTPVGDVVQTAFLAGNREPEIRVSGLAGYTPNGQAMPFTSGSFDTDTFDIRVRVLNGSGVRRSESIILSNGTGAVG